MSQQFSIYPVAYIHSGFPEKFGIPRQSGLIEALKADIIFEPEYAVPEAVRGMEAYSHLWLIWGFSESQRETWSPTVRPPRLGGNIRMGVFATRSPFRPNSLGLSCVRLEGIETDTADGPVLHVAGADLMDGTPIFDIKPYLPLSDIRLDATEGFAGEVKDYRLEVVCPPEYLSLIPEAHRGAVLALLAQDPRPSYQKDASRVYGMKYEGMNIRFRVNENVLTVCGVTLSE